MSDGEAGAATPEPIAENLARLKDLFPEAFNEGKVDFEVLEQLLGGALEDREERFGLHWHGKQRARQLALSSSSGTLRPRPQQSVDWQGTGNLMIEGDNLEVLKLLQKSYAGKVTVIYIDPPYNTGKDFVYPDNYQDNLRNYLELTGQSQGGARQSSNPETSGRFHTAWLNMIYPRLKLARGLLASDGFIAISIDDSELGTLRMVCDELFGAENFIGPVVRNTNSSKNQSQFLSVSHDYALFYARDLEALTAKAQVQGAWEVRKNNLESFLQQLEQLRQRGLSPEEMTEEIKELVKRPRFIDFVNYWHFDAHAETRGVYRKGDLGGVKNGNPTPLMNPLTGKPDPVPPGGFRFDSRKLAELVADNRIHFHTDGSLPTIKRYLKENLNSRPKSIMSDDQRPDVGLLQRLGIPFDNPKQLAFLKRILSVADKDSLILDFFAGSGTTGHAVMELNAEDGGTRRFILVQYPEPTKAEGFRHLAEMTERRLVKAAELIRAEHATEPSLDLGFRLFRLDSSNLKAWEPKREALASSLLEAIEQVKADRTGEDLLFELMLKLGLDLGAPVDERIVAGKRFHIVEGGRLLACLAEKIGVEDAEALAEGLAQLHLSRDTTVIFRDSAFADDVVKANLVAILRQRGLTNVRSL